MHKINTQRGFTLIELLVVIAILAVIATVVVLNVSSFIGAGRVQAANTELHQVQTAIVSYQADDGEYEFSGAIGPEDNYPVDAPATEGVHKYLTNPGSLQAVYTVEAGSVVNATLVEDSQWRDLYFCGGQWQEEECGA